MQEIRDELIPQVVLSWEGAEESEPVLAKLRASLIRLKDFIDTTYARPEGMYSKVRKMLAEVTSNPEILKMARQVIRQNQHDFKAMQKKAQAVVAHKNSHQTVLSMLYIREVIQRLKASEVFSDNVILLMLACGARKIEILDAETSSFFGHNSIPDRITQAGVAKRRTDEPDQPITKPLLFLKPLDFLARLRKIRAEVDSRGKKGRIAIGKTFSHQLENLCQHLWPQHVDNGYRTGTHINRAIYANVAYKKFGSPSESLTHFIKKKLGHDTMGSAANYMNVSIAYDEESALAEEASRQAVVLEEDKVTLEDNDGHLHEFVRCQMRRMDIEDREDLAKRCAKQLRAAGVPVTRKNLMELGIQSVIVTSSEVLSKE